MPRKVDRGGYFEWVDEERETAEQCADRLLPEPVTVSGDGTSLGRIDGTGRTEWVTKK